MFVNTPEKPLERTAKIGEFIARLYHKEQPKVDPQQTLCSRCLERGHRDAACSNNIRCGECCQEGHKRGDPVCEAVSVWGPRGSDRQQGDTGVTITREPLSQHELSDNEAASNDEDQWEDPQPAINDTQSEQPSQRVNVRKQSVSRKTKVSGKKQALDSKKKAELVHRGRQLAIVHAKQTKLDFEQRTRDTMPKRTRSDTGGSPSSTSLTGKHARLTDTSEAGDTTQNSTSQPT